MAAYAICVAISLRTVIFIYREDNYLDLPSCAIYVYDINIWHIYVN